MLYDEPISPDEEACLRYMMNRNRQMRGMCNMAGVQDVMNCLPNPHNHPLS